jgi:hypothetical protein
MKRVFSITIIALAVITLLVSVVVPHHHHGNTVCFNLSHCCEHESGSDGHQCEGHSSDYFPYHHHSEESKASDNNCPARVTYLVSSRNELKHKIHSNDEHNKDIHFIPLFVSLTNFYVPDVTFVSLTGHRYRERYFFREPATLNRINGLRAPPYCTAA